LKAPSASRARRTYTFRWPHHPVDFSGKRVAVIGTGSSAVQSIPIIARQAAALTVFQRTPNYSRPAKNGPVSAEKQTRFDSDPAAYREAARQSSAGVPRELPLRRAFDVSEAERVAAYEEAYQSGDLLALGGTFLDLGADPAANETVCEFMRGKIRSLVRDPETAEALSPKNHFYGTKRPCIDTEYYETYNLPHVRLVDLRADPIRTITETGIDTASRSFEFDAIVYATGFDAMTGALVAVDIRGRDGLPLKDKWIEGPRTYLGLMTRGFPNLFTITGPGSPSVLSNMVVSIEQHVDWIGACLAHMRAHGLATIEPTAAAEAGWVQHVNDFGDITLFPRANSWYMGANVPGKPRVFLPYIGGVDRYRTVCDEVVRHDYLGFAFGGLPARAAPTASSGAYSRTPRSCSSWRRSWARRWKRCRCPTRAPSWWRWPRIVRAAPRSATWSMATCRGRPGHWRIASTARTAAVRIPSSSTSTAVAGCSAAMTRTIRSAATSASARRRSSSRSTIATRPRRASQRLSTTPGPPFAGSRPTPRRWEATRRNWPSAAGAPAATSPPASVRRRAMPADRASPARCW
jgi:cation diffusion facilitator CzcD-associated flavoprotein CzcO